MRVGILAVTLLIGGSARAGTLRVPEDYPSVLAAVDAAVAGDSVVVGPGTWSQTATRVVMLNGQTIPLNAAAFLKPGIVVVGAGAATTVLDGGTGGVAFAYTTSSPDTTTVANLTARGVNSLVSSQNGPLFIKDCWLSDNTQLAADIANVGQVVFQDCLFERNGGEVVVITNSPVEFHSCIFQGNLSRAIRSLSSPRLVIEDCEFTDHGRYVGACKLQSVLDLQIRRCLFVRNRDLGGNGGAVFAGSSTGVIEFCTFVNDSALFGGAVATVGTGSVRLTGNTFAACHGSNLASAVYLDSTDPGVDHNIFAYSTGPDGAVGRSYGANAATTGCNIFWANAGGDFWSYGPWGPAPTDIFADPQFCDTAMDDLTLHSTSPGAPGVTPACGGIGALGVGCGPVSVEGASWARIKTQYR